MRRKTLAIAFLFLTGGIFLGQEPAANEKEVIDRFLTAWHKAAETADETVYFDSIADDGVFIGTDAGERWDKAAFLKFALPYFTERQSAWTFRASERHIYISADGRLAWFDEVLFSQSYWTSRGSGVLEKTGGNWGIKQYVLSFTIPNAVAREVKSVVSKHLPPETK